MPFGRDGNGGCRGCAPQQTLSRALAAGEYSAVLKYECFADEAETEPLNGSEIALTLRVQ